ncbi:hypothetical protein RN607_01665 [Demequina capsici]|uniref:Uncharacterized protein n=1 Tax=Demequina capsici TaxID=3075620 RepID=A0AA96FAT1_9MICO|nr:MULTISPECIES: hypothetical protein [unclassified Demequina]WNM24830.1 hypothetical protein RN606_01390 [Demequina sp. OYTSA14]WNM27737.1 hypothetical protein RN607_01665 [Demequina sp. PMTSA13]
MSEPSGYAFRARPNGDVHILHLGKLAKILKDDAAALFLTAVKEGDAQAAMADAVGGSAATRPGGNSRRPGAHLHGNGEAHAQQQFRRKSG